MAANPERHRTRLSLDIEPELQRKIKSAAAEQNLPIHDYVVTILQRALAAANQDHTASAGIAWTQLSIPSFARDWDWDSDEDQVYDYDRLREI